MRVMVLSTQRGGGVPKSVPFVPFVPARGSLDMLSLLVVGGENLWDPDERGNRVGDDRVGGRVHVVAKALDEEPLRPRNGGGGGLAVLDTEKRIGAAVYHQRGQRKPLEGLGNMRSLYLSNNRISDFSPALKLTKLWSLYLDHNQITKLDGVAGLKGLTTLSAGNNDITDLGPLKGLTRLHFLFLENNKVANLAPLVEMAGADYKGPKNFAPFLRLYLKGNPVDGATGSRLQFARLMKYGVRVETPRQPELVTFDSTGWSGELTGEQLVAFQRDILEKFDLVKDARVKLQLTVSPEDGITKQEVDELKAALKKLGLNDKVDLSF